MLFITSKNICTPRDLFTYEVIITLRILMLSQLILQMVYIYFSMIAIAVTHLEVTLRRGDFAPLIPSEARMVSFCSIVLVFY